MNSILSDALDIRYVKLHFTVRFNEESNLPRYKTSAIRGGMGEMLLRANCIRNRECDNCDFFSECIVQRTMYSQFDNKPAFVTTGDSVGYVVECEDYHKRYNANDTLSFSLILFGKTIVYFNQYMQALYALGVNGIGKEHATFQIVSVTNSKGVPILNGYDIFMEKYEVCSLRDYVEWRLGKVNHESNLEIKFPFLTSIKYEGEVIKSFSIEAIIRALKRRLYILDCFEEKNCKDAYDYSYDVPNLISEESTEDFLERYSTRKDKRMRLRGIYGNVKVTAVSKDLLAILLAGEIIHIGKNTSMGFGRMTVKDIVNAHSID